MIIIKAIVKTEGPLSLAMPVAQGTQANAYGNFPMIARGIDEEGEKQYSAYLPATTIRGFLRRAIVLKDMEEAAAQNQHYKLEQAYAELIGQDAASEQQAGDIDLIALKKTRESSPVLDLFGSGLGIKSRLRVSHFMPSHNVLPDPITGSRKDLGDNEEAFALVDESEKSEFFERSEANTKRARAATQLVALQRQLRGAKRQGESIEELTLQVEAAKELVGKYEAAMGEMKNSSRTILTHYALAAGLELTGKFVIENPKDRDTGLIETGLNALSLFPILGAQSARGCGEISGTFDFMQDGVMFKRVAIGGFEAAKVDEF
ncbi:MAG: hypothetical protein ISP76_05210 [Burkholderiales bacterium]|nr:hypothetical protein [Burkholderiales bacterium]